MCLDSTVGTLPRRPRQLPAVLSWLWFLPVTLLLWIAMGLPTPMAEDVLTSRVQGLVTVFLGIFIEALPFVVAGVLVSSVIALFVGEQVIQRLAPEAPVHAALVGSLLGLAFPVCECGTVPTTRRLLHKGARYCQVAGTERISAILDA